MLVIDGTNTTDPPAILLTGQHHPREAISSTMALFSVLKVVHGSVHNEPKYVELLKQNKYYVIPTVNVDGLAYIEHEFLKTGKMVAKRTNMHFEKKHDQNCTKILGGVDLNRNYDWHFGKGSTDHEECEGS